MSGLHFLPLTDGERQEMLRQIGAAAVDDLFADVPEKVRLAGVMQLPPPLSELEVLDHLRALAAKIIISRIILRFLAPVKRMTTCSSVVGHITGRSSFITAYTPTRPRSARGFTAI